VQVYGISFDTVEENRAFAEKFSFPFRLLSDPERKAGLAFGACATAQDKYAARYTFVIGPDGTIEQAIDTEDPAAQAAEILATL
jgi:peroxiredoxin Q/BCP